MNTNFIKFSLIFLFSIGINTIANSQDVMRKRPAGWENLVYGGRFQDRFLPLPDHGQLSSDTWGAQQVLPRHVENGIEDNEYSYWGGNIIKDNGKFQMFVCRWREDEPKGHLAWPKAEVVRAVADNPVGPYRVAQVIGHGHNPELHHLSDGGYFLYVNNFGAHDYYYSDHIDGPWIKKEFKFDARQRPITDHMANNTFTKRPDGSMLMVGRGGDIWISKTGESTYKMVSNGSVYPPYEGKYEDPVVWRTNVQYHLIVNDWLGRIAYYMRSKDGIKWVLDDGEAYMPGIAKQSNGKVEDWYKFERIKVLQDKYGRAYQANFAVCDTIKKQDRGSDNHSSKNISIPLTVGKLITIIGDQKIDDKTKEIKLLIKAENGFNPQTDINIKSLRFGAPQVIDYGGGCTVTKKERLGNDLLLTFKAKGNGFNTDNFAGKLLGSDKDGKLLYAFCRLPWVNYKEPYLSAKYPEISLIENSIKLDIDIENFGLVTSANAKILIEYQQDNQWKELTRSNLSKLKPFESKRVSMWGKKVEDRGKAIKVRVNIISQSETIEILQGKVVIR
ncbi:glycoside hydrolase family protein [Persicobacter psychrovividus]|uniref:Uncharacterized protein n=1 Tax=Persicobacter psychrovividus TaxID=387638 RepID=A0ABM7VMS4_9BACT|nr:hypothetical protein PEPS_45990 [Persicobacter psychrovividus]